MLIIGSLLYWFLYLVYPTYFEDFWYLGQYWWTNLFLGIPLEEYLWFFLTGSYIGPLYEYVSGMSLSEMNMADQEHPSYATREDPYRRF